jgi:ABC-2 type transport system ATP-binding protein
MAVTADHVIVIGKGRLLRDQPMSDFIREADVDSIRVVTPEPERLSQVLERSGATVTTDTSDPDPEPALTVAGTTAREVGTRAAEAGITLWELTPSAGSLEDAYLALTRESLDYQDRADDPSSQERAS